MGKLPFFEKVGGARYGLSDYQALISKNEYTDTIYVVMRWSEESVRIVVPSGDLSKSSVSVSVLNGTENNQSLCGNANANAVKNIRVFLCCRNSKELGLSLPLSTLEITA